MTTGALLIVIGVSFAGGVVVGAILTILALKGYDR